MKPDSCSIIGIALREQAHNVKDNDNITALAHALWWQKSSGNKWRKIGEITELYFTKCDMFLDQHLC